MAPTKKKGANDGEDNSPRSDAKKNLSLKGEGRPLSPASSSAPKCGDANGGRPVESRCSGEGDGAREVRPWSA